jgi:hypothetical protein
MAEMLMTLKQERSELAQRCEAYHADLSGESTLMTIVPIHSFLWYMVSLFSLLLVRIHWAPYGARGSVGL